MMTQSTSAIGYDYYPASSSNTLKGSDEETLETASTTDVSTLDKDDFLTLLIAELQNQDPLNPADNTEFIAQLAQFSTLEQMTNMNETLTATLESNSSMAQSVSNAMIVNYFGKTVTAESGTFAYSGEGEIELQFELDSAVNYGTVQILDADGNIVDNGTIYDLDEGLHTFTWDALSSLGTQLDEGYYTLSIEVYDSFGEEVTATPLYTGTVDGISYKDGETMLSIDGVMVSYDNVRRIVDTDTMANADTTTVTE